MNKPALNADEAAARAQLLAQTTPASTDAAALVSLAITAAADHAEDLTGMERNIALGMAVSIIEAVITFESPAAADLIGVPPDH